MHDLLRGYAFRGLQDVEHILKELADTKGVKAFRVLHIVGVHDASSRMVLKRLVR